MTLALAKPVAHPWQPAAARQHRILHCIPTLGGGGAERQLGYLARELTGLGWEVHVAYGEPGVNLARLQSAGAVLHPLGIRTSHDPRLAWRLRNVARRCRPDIIQTWLLQMDILGGLVSCWGATPWIISQRRSAAAYPPTLKNQLRCWIARRADAIVSNSAAGQDYWHALLHRPARRRVVPNALPLEEIAAAPAAKRDVLGISHDDKLLVHVGRLTEQKNVRTLLDALRRVPASLRLKTIFCGDGSLGESMNRWIREYGLADQVRLLGYTPHVWNWLKTADACVSVSLFEGHPNALVEAAACGCPLVASDIPEHREFLCDETALIVDPHRPQAIAQAIETCLACPHEARARARRARESVQHLSTVNMARAYLDIYQEVLNVRN